jgi:hypothetical protein
MKISPKILNHLILDNLKLKKPITKTGFDDHLFKYVPTVTLSYLLLKETHGKLQITNFQICSKILIEASKSSLRRLILWI